MNVEERLRAGLHAYAATIEVEDRPWSEVVKRAKRLDRRNARVPRAAAAVVAVVLCTALLLTLWPKARSVDGRAVVSVRQQPTGEVVAAARNQTAAGTWELVSLPTSYGTCVGVRAVEPGRLPPRVPVGWPQAAVQCVPDVREAGDAVFVVGLRTASAELEPFLVGLSNRGDRPLRIRVNDGGVVTVAPVPLGNGLVGFAVPLARAARTVDVAWEGDGSPRVEGLPVVVHGDSPRIVVGASEDHIVSAFYDARGGLCMVTRRRGALVDERPPLCPVEPDGRPPVAFPGGTELGIEGYAPPDTGRVLFFDRDDALIGTTLPFGCEAGFSACFYQSVVDRPVARVVFEPR